MAALLRLSPENLVSPKTLCGPFPLAGVSWALVPVTDSRPVGERFATRRKSNPVRLRCSKLPVVDSTNDKPIIVIDNYDSFTYNLCQYIGELGAKFEVYRNDELSVNEIRRKRPIGLLISPGPGAPKDSGISLQTVLELGPCVPLFGVCMGLQCIGEAFGGKIVRSPYGVVHGKSAKVYYDEKLDDMLFSDLPKSFHCC